MFLATVFFSVLITMSTFIYILLFLVLENQFKSNRHVGGSKTPPPPPFLSTYPFPVIITPLVDCGPFLTAVISERTVQTDSMLSLFSSYLIVAGEAEASKDSLSSGAVAGIVIAVILIVLVAIDLFCCFFNSCGLFFCCSQALCGGGSGAKKEDCKYYAGMRSSHLAWSFLVERVSNFFRPWIRYCQLWLQKSP